MNHEIEQSPGYRNPKTTLEKMLALITLLKYERRKTKKELADILGKSERQVYRDLKMLENFFSLDYDSRNRPFIFTEVNEDELMINLTFEEMATLKAMVEKSRSPFKKSLISKLDINLQIDFDSDSDLAVKIETIELAIDSKMQIVLKNYTSANSKKVRDIIVEPIAITEFKYLTAFDVIDQKNKVFSIERIEAIQDRSEVFAHEKKHQRLKPDPFGMAGGITYSLDLLMTDRAYLLMREEYPRSKGFVAKIDHPDFSWRFFGVIHGLEGIGRFVMGLPGEIKVETPTALGDYIREKSKGLLNIT